MVENVWVRYRQGWGTAVVVLAAMGVVAAFLFVGMSTIVVAFLMAGILAGAIHLSVGLAQERQTVALMREVLRWAVRAGAAVVAICGYAAAIGTATLWLLVLIAVTSPPAIGWLQLPRAAAAPADPARAEPAAPATEQKSRGAERKSRDAERKSRGAERKRRRPAEPEPPESPATPEVRAPAPADPVQVTDLSDEELCFAWRRSFLELEKCTTDEQRLDVVTRRRAYLDELERRAPDAFAGWLESGARAAGDPSKFFTPRTNHGGPD